MYLQTPSSLAQERRGFTLGNLSYPRGHVAVARRLDAYSALLAHTDQIKDSEQVLPDLGKSIPMLGNACQISPASHVGKG